MSEKTVSSRSVGAFLASVALAIRKNEAEIHPKPQFVRNRLELHLEAMISAESPLSESQRMEIATLRDGLQKYLNQALRQ